MEPITPDGAERASEEAHAVEESGSRASAAEQAAAAVEEIRREYEGESERAESPREYAQVLRRARVRLDRAAGPPQIYHHFSLLASPDTTVPPSNDSYICPYGDETWERVHVGDEVPVCSKHGVRLISA
jgi:hypothetical protein